MDRKAANNVIVGIFVTLAFVVFVFVVFNMGGGGGLLGSQLSIFGKFSQVKGLHNGSEVSLSGLRIGVVKEIQVTDTASKDLIVQMNIAKKYARALKEDSIATIKTQGVLGDKYIEISIGSETSPALKQGDFIKTAEPPDLFAKGGDMVSEISRYFNKGGDFEGLLRNLSVLSENLAKLTNDVEKQQGMIHEFFYGNSGNKLNKSMGHIENILGKIDRGEGTLGSLINDPTVYEDLKSLMGGAKRSTILRYFMRQFIDSGEKASTPAKK